MTVGPGGLTCWFNRGFSQADPGAVIALMDPAGKPIPSFGGFASWLAKGEDMGGDHVKLRPMLVVSEFEFRLSTDTVEKLDFLPRSQFLRQQAGFKKRALRGPAESRCATPVANWCGNVWRYRLCLTKVWFSDVAHFPSFSTVSTRSGSSIYRCYAPIADYPRWNGPAALETKA